MASSQSYNFTESKRKCRWTTDDKLFCTCDVERGGERRVVTTGGTNCQDVNECKVENGGCAHKCTNYKPGDPQFASGKGYACSCNNPPNGEPLWNLSPNLHDCIGEFQYHTDHWVDHI